MSIWLNGVLLGLVQGHREVAICNVGSLNVCIFSNRRFKTRNRTKAILDLQNKEYILEGETMKTWEENITNCLSEVSVVLLR